MFDRLTGWVQQISGRLAEQSCAVPSALPSLVESIEQARGEWLSSRAYFEAVSDPDLVDHAIYMMEAAEKRYIYLLKKAREANIVESV